MPLASNVELLFEVIEGLDASDLQIVLAQLGDDIQFEESLVNIDGAQYVGVWTNHFSPYTLFDELSDEEKAELEQALGNLSDEDKAKLEDEVQKESAQNQVKTGDQVSLFTISGLGLTMTLALGLMLSTNSNKRKFDE